MVRDKPTPMEESNNDDVCEIIEDSKPIETPKTQLEYYKESLAYEEEEVGRRSSDHDKQQFTNTCSSIRKIMAEILEIKLAKSENAAVDVESCRVKIMMKMLNLRKLSRTQKVRVRMARESALESRQVVDAVTLQLQGLLYEILHLQKESQRCLLAHTADKDIDLLPLEQFYEQAPQNISRPEVTLDDPHQQRLARLHWELEQRRGQTTLTDSMTQEFNLVQTQITDFKQKIDALGPRIEMILASTVPLQEALNLPLSALKTQQETARLLPMALYTLWMQTSAYGEACDSLIKCVIKGDAEAALKIRKQEQEASMKTSEHSNLNTNDNTPAVSDNEGEDSSNDKSNKRSRRDKTSVSTSTIKGLFDLHPLFVELSVADSHGSFVVIQFYYATELRVITCKCSVVSQVNERLPGAIVMTDVLSGSDFLDCLFADDTGLSSPNPSTPHQLKNQSLTQFPEDFGRTYNWAQLLGGMMFPALELTNKLNPDDELMEVAEDLRESEERSSNDVSVERVHVTLSAIRQRLTSRLVLQQQLMSLQGANTTSCIPIPPGSSEMFPGKVSSELVSWVPISFTDYSQLNCTQMLRDNNLASPRSFYFKAQYRRKHVEMLAYVCVAPDYPNTVPLFAIDLSWGGKTCPYDHVHQLEAEVNVHWPELVTPTGTIKTQRSDILPLMLYRLAMCLDVYTEAISSRLGRGKSLPQSLNQQHFQKEKIFFRPSKGPDRALPLKYLPKLRVFSQR